MKRTQTTIDTRPGALPDIKTSGADITFVMSPAGTHPLARLIIRCDDRGDVWVAIEGVWVAIEGSAAPDR
jgi:hypothetical protein